MSALELLEWLEAITKDELAQCEVILETATEAEPMTTAKYSRKMKEIYLIYK